MKVNVYIGKEKIGEKDADRYVCVSHTVREMVDAEYRDYLNSLAPKSAERK